MGYHSFTETVGFNTALWRDFDRLSTMGRVIFVSTLLLALAICAQAEEKDVPVRPAREVPVRPAREVPVRPLTKEKRGSGDCYVPGDRVWRKHGETFDLRQHGCATYRCWYGNLDIVEHKCEVDGQCHSYGEVFEYHCLRTRCVSDARGWHTEYIGGDTKCADSSGRCHDDREVFSDYMHGRYWNECVCNGSSGIRCFG